MIFDETDLAEKIMSTTFHVFEDRNNTYNGKDDSFTIDNFTVFTGRINAVGARERPVRCPKQKSQKKRHPGASSMKVRRKNIAKNKVDVYPGVLAVLFLLECFFFGGGGGRSAHRKGVFTVKACSQKM